MPSSLISLRRPQRVAFENTLGLLAFIWRRQFGKSYTLGAIGLDWMLEGAANFQKTRDVQSLCDVIFVSAAVRLGQENVRKESAIWRDAVARAKARGLQITTTADDDRGRLLDPDAIADLYEHQKLETKLWVDNSNACRSIVVAPNPDTAVGWTGHIILDEVGRMPEFRDVWEALEPIVSSQQRFRIRLATTPPPDDTHYSYELLAPQLDDGWQPNADGCFYTSRAGLAVHRVDAWDAYAAGVPLYDLKTREPLTPEESRRRSIDKIAWDRNYGCRFISGGTAAISLMALMNAQTAGERQGATGIKITDHLEVA